MAVDKNIFYFWTGPEISAKYQASLTRTRLMNPEHNVLVLDDTAVLPMLRGIVPEMADIYQKIIIPAAKSDIARLAALYVHGGWYLDFDTFSRTGLVYYEAPGKDLYLTRTIRKNGKGTIPSSPIAGKKGHEFFREALVYILKILESKLDHYSVYSATGPSALLAAAGKHLNSESTSWEDIDYTFMDVVPDGTKGSWTFQESCGIWADEENPVIFRPSRHIERTARVDALPFFLRTFQLTPSTLKRNAVVFSEKVLEHYLKNGDGIEAVVQFYNDLLSIPSFTHQEQKNIMKIAASKGLQGLNPAD